MGKNPAFQFYPSDWTRDLNGHPLDIQGAWIRIICCLWWENPRGKAIKDIDEWARILGVDEKETERILNYLGGKKIGEIKSTVTRNAKVTASHKKITVISRRMYRQEKLRELNRLRQERFRNKRKSNTTVTPPSSDLLFFNNNAREEKPGKSIKILIEGKNGKPLVFDTEKKETSKPREKEEK